MKKKILAFGIALCMLFGFAIVPTYAATSGTCGDNLTWTLDDNGTLTISGSGAMANYSEESFVPWRGRSVKTVVIESSVTSIGDRAFYKCSSLESITIPDSVTSIERYAFAGCSSLTSITIPAGVTTIGYKAFYNTAYYNDDSKWENGVLYINNHIIAAKTDVTSITIKPETRTIAVAVFRGCSDLKSITIPNSVAIIGDYAFYECSSLTSITIPNSVAIIGDSAFYKCSSLISITIPDSVTSIERYAFAGCSSLTSITIPDSVTTIGAVAFGDCSSLTDVYYSGTEEDWNKISIDSGNYDLTNATRHHIPALSVARDENTFTVMPKNVEAGSIILTTYKNGAVTELKTAEYDGEPAEFTVTSDYDSIKIMLWNSFNDMQPLVSAKKQ